MNYENAKYADANHLTISVLIHGKLSTVPVSPGNIHYTQIITSGVSIAPYVAPDVTEDQMKQERNKLLRLSDYMMLSDYPKGSASDQQILDYRQSLRDFPQGLNLKGKKSIGDLGFPQKPS